MQSPERSHQRRNFGQDRPDLDAVEVQWMTVLRDGNGDADGAWRGLDRAYRGLLTFKAQQAGVWASRAEELVQDCWLRLLPAIASYHDGEPVRMFVRRNFRYALSDYFKSMLRAKRDPRDAGQREARAEVHVDLDDAQNREVIQQALARPDRGAGFPERDWQRLHCTIQALEALDRIDELQVMLLMRRHVLEETLEEMAEVIDMAPRTLEGELLKAKRRMVSLVADCLGRLKDWRPTA